MKKIVVIIFAIIINITFAQTWEFVGLDSMVIYGLQVKGDTIWAGTRDVSINDNSGLYKSINLGQHWVKLDSSLGTIPITFFSIDENNSSIIYMIQERSSSSNSSNFYKSTTSGEIWDTISTPGDKPIRDFILSPFNNSEYYIISKTQGHEWSMVQQFYKTTNSGEDWEKLCCAFHQEIGLITFFTIDHFDPNILYISSESYNSLILKSNDRGETWQEMSEHTRGRIISDFTIQSRLYLFSFDEEYVSNDGGIIWDNISEGLPPDLYFISFYQDTQSEIIYLLKKDGLYYSNRNSTFWKLVSGSDNLPFRYYPAYTWYSVNTISIDHENNYTYVGTSNGIYRTGIVTAIDESEQHLSITNYSLAQNYPNPFNPTTIIKYEIPGQARNDNILVVLKIYDVLGNEITTLVNEEKPVGSYEVEFDGDGLTSGIYFYRIEAGSFIETKKMILIK